ncbi:MAG: FtsQ-type POTRA domain-containing protein [Opitutaceae bacterium]|jgi:cell division protein FtsQ|nr:FtsQ-type POTRA domain-containing protein [Opitutaceae bacterium]
MKHLPIPPTPSPNSWRRLARQSAPPASTPISQKRQTRDMIKKIALCMLLGIAAIITFEIYTAWERNPASVKAPVRDTPLKDIAFQSNGVLDRAWAIRTLALPAGIDMMELDLSALRARLLANPQVCAAVLSRQFPDTLAITLEERSPVARLIIQQTTGEREELLVATDGVIYSGVNYAPATLATLPYLADVALFRTASGAHEYLPLNGIDFVARLVDEARVNIPDRYATWKSISLKRYDEDRLLIVNTNGSYQITFSARDEVANLLIHQIARLDYMLDDLARTATPARGALRAIDLSVGLTASGIIQVPVTFYPLTALGTPRRSQ